MFRKGDWVSIEYGEYTGGYGKVAAVNLDGSCKVIPYNKKDEPDSMIQVEPVCLALIPPYLVDREKLRKMVRAEIIYRDLSSEVFPAFNIRAEESYRMTPEDISDALRNINEKTNCLGIFKEWFWMIQNVFYESLEIEDRYDEKIFSDAPDTEDELFSTVYGLTERLYWKLEERFVNREDTEKYVVKFDYELGWGSGLLTDTGLEETAYKAVCEDIFSRVRTFLYNRERPRSEWIYSPSQKRHTINSYEDSEDILKAPEPEKRLYKKFVADLFRLKDVQAMKILAWGYFAGDSVYRQSFRQAEKYLKILYERTGDPYAANALGYIYYRGLTNQSEPVYDKAFRYYSYGALAGLDESIYMSAEMLIHGKGTVKNIDMGLNLIVDGYRDSLFQFSDGEYHNRFADYAYWMGNVCKENLILGMGIRDAYKFYLEADFAIRKRMASGNPAFGDEEAAERIRSALEQIKQDFHPDQSKSVLRADFPIYISHMFEDRFPIRVQIYKEGANRYLKMSRFRLIPGDEPKILVTLPELSYVNLVSELKYRLEETGVIKLPEKGGSFLADGFTKNDHTNALEFYSGGELVAAIEAKWFVIDVTKEKMLLKLEQGEK